jgi:two-component system, OmpR family, response regulator
LFRSYFWSRLVTPQPTAVVIEDDDDVSNLITAVLQDLGFTVHKASTGPEGVDAVHRFLPDLITVDVGLPGFDGVEATRRIREFSDAYILMITARTDELDVLLGLKSGADDYLTKPFRLRELSARITAVQRRPRRDRTGRQGKGKDARQGKSELLVHNGLELHPGEHSVHVDGRKVELTPTEFEMLQVLLSEGGRKVRSRTELVRKIRTGDYNAATWVAESEERTIDVHVSNLRKKLGERAGSARWLQTIRGVGYRLAT